MGVCGGVCGWVDGCVGGVGVCGWGSKCEARESIHAQYMQLLNTLNVYTHAIIVQQINWCHAITAVCKYLNPFIDFLSVHDPKGINSALP